MSGTLFYSPFHRAFTTVGVPASGEKLYFYLTGGTTATPAYADAALASPLSNPVVADSAGRFPAIYLDTAISYRVVQKTAADVTVPNGDRDPVAFPVSLTTAGVQAIVAAELVAGANVTITPAGVTLVIAADLTNAKPIEAIIVPVFDTPTVVTAGVGKFSFRMPYAFTLSSVRASLATAQATGALMTANVKANGVSLFSTKSTLDNTEKTTTTALTPSVLTATPLAIADDAEMTFDVDTVGDGTGKGLIVTLIGRRT